jgi:uncharacterized protein YxjI
MTITAVCQCGKNYHLKDEFAGKSVKCPACGNPFVVPASKRIAQADPIFDRDKFLVRQKRIAISEKYYIADEQGAELAFAHRPAALMRILLIAVCSAVWVLICLAGAVAIAEAISPQNKEEIGGLIGSISMIGGIAAIIYFLAPKRHVTFYRDAEMDEPLMQVRQDFKIALINAEYPVVDAQGTRLAVLRKNFLYNIIRKRWYIDAADGTPLCVAMEDSIVLSLLRRFLGPMLGLLRTNFVIMKPDMEETLGEFNLKLTFFDKYLLDLTDDPDRTLDRRVALALGVMLDTGERR